MTEASVLHGDALSVLRTLAPGSVDAVVTDPPYGLAFMGKEWDHGVPGVPFWEAALAVAKPGAHLLAFGGTRTFHRLTCAIEDAGWEIRDCLMWLYGSGFPKSLNLGGEWKGWGTALKPAWEPIVMARKPLVGTVAANVAAHGTGALNVDGCRIGTGDNLNGGAYSKDRKPSDSEWVKQGGTIHSSTGKDFSPPSGRWPANVALDEDAARLLDEQSGETSSRHRIEQNSGRADESQYRIKPTPGTVKDFGDTGGASRFFYCAKASRAEREAGLDGMPERAAGSSHRGEAAGRNSEASRMGAPPVRAANHHPTVKPVALMRWLVRLVTPPGGLVLDPFAGSGTTGIACVLEGFGFLGIEREEAYVAIARRRIAAAQAQTTLDLSGRTD